MPRTLLERSPDEALSFRYRLLRLGQLKAAHEFDRAIAEGTELLTAARTRRDWRAELQVLLALEEGWERFHAFSRFLDDAMQLAQAQPGDELTWWTRNEWADRLRSQGRTEDAERLMLAVLQEQVAAKDHVQQLRTLINLGMFYRGTRQWDKLQPLGPRAIRIADQIGRTPTLLAHFLCNQSDALLLAGMPAQALEMADAALVAARGAPGSTRIARFNRAKALNRLGLHDEGLALLEAETQGRDRWEALDEVAEEYAFAQRYDKAYATLAEHLQGLKQHQEEAHRAGLSLDQALMQADRERAERQASERQTQRIVTAAIIAAALSLAGAAFLVARSTRRHAKELAALNARLEEMALHDPLTGLHNRRHFMARVEGQAAFVDRSQRDSARTGVAPLSLVFLLVDLDHFKRVNDTHGHPAGDAVLRQVARRLKDFVRCEDVLVRWGGEEFLLMTMSTTPEQTDLLAERICQAMRSAPIELPDGQQLDVSCSIGFASYPARASGRWEDAVEAADQALYRAKQAGRDRWVGASEAETVAIPRVPRIAAASPRRIAVGGPKRQ